MNKFNQILKNVLVFLVVFLVINYIMQTFFGKGQEAAVNDGNLIFQTTDTEYSPYQTVTVEISNHTDKAVNIANNCPAEPLKVERYENNEWVSRTVSPKLDCSSSKEVIVQPGESTKIAYDNWNFALFSDLGRFRISLETELNGENKVIHTNEFTVVEEGLFRKLWIGVFYKPIYNGLIFLASILPGHYLGWAIILLTLVIRTILLVPSQRAMKAQKRMQEVQPRLEKIKEKYKGDQQRIAMETMAIWKETKVSPMSSCLPLLLQFPFLIALYHVVMSGLNPDNAFLLYSNYNNFELSDINVYFLWLDLTKINLYVLPLVIGALQFLQMKLAMAKKAKSDKENGKEVKNEMAMATNMMIYFMPVMIAIFTATLPAGVGIYWGTSTIYGIIQQLFVNKGGNEKSPDEPTVKVISK